MAPRNSASSRDEGVLQQPELVKKLLLDHIVLGSRIDLTNLTSETTFKTLGGREVHVRTGKEGRIEANGATIIEPKITVPNGLLIVIDNYLFPDDQIIKKNNTKSKLDIGMLSVVNVKEEGKTLQTAPSNTSFIENIMQVLSFLKSGVRVFQHFLSRSNVSHLLTEGKSKKFVLFVSG